MRNGRLTGPPVGPSLPGARSLHGPARANAPGAHGLPARLPGPIRRSRIPRGLRQFIAESIRVMRDPSLLLWSLYILMFPLYVIPSGLPQPGDWLLLLLVPTVLTSGRNALPGVTIPAVRALFLFTGYLTLDNLVWSVAIDSYTFAPKTGFLLTPIWYIYNVLFFVIALILYNRYHERFLWLTLQLTLGSVVLQALISLVVWGRGGSRASVLFNNPNQLGYFAVLSASILALGRRRLGLGTVPATIGFIACGYLALLSSSKAALGAIAILICLALLSNPRIIIASSVAFLLLLSFANPVTRALEGAQARIETDKHYGFFEERGYDRITKNKEYWIFGAGEGAYKRFEDTTIINDHEIHSSAGTIFFCYGIIGSLLFILFCMRIARGSPFRRLLLLMPAAAYGVTHQGLRFTLLWVLLAMFISLYDHDRRSGASPPPRRRLRVPVLPIRKPTVGAQAP
jgi:hypothetical protein